jgi:hypothetical protein
VDAPIPSTDALVRPWRTATIVASLIAAVELIALMAVGAALLAKPLSHAVEHQAQARAFAPAPKAKPKPASPTAVAPTLSRSQTSVLVLNGNGRTGAASSSAAKLQRRGYRITGTGNAPRGDYATSVVMFRAGYRGEALRVARDLHLKVVGPLDGLKPKQLLGGQVAVVLGVG